MRIHLKLSPNTELVPFECQPKLVGTLHKWLGKKNDYHDELSLYSMSWLKKGKVVQGKGLDFKEGAEWFISSPDQGIIAKVMNGLWSDPTVMYGMKVEKAEMKIPPPFGTKARLLVENPVFVKEKIDDKKSKHYLYNEPEVNDLMTAILQQKIEDSGLGISKEITVRFDDSYTRARERTIRYRKIKNKCSECPVILEGEPEAIAFAWGVGIGNSTGIGFGALR